MLKDLCITEILNVYHNETLTWKRSEPIERNKSGLVLFTEGEIEYYFPKQTIVATRGSLMLFPPNVPYYGKAQTQRVAYCVINFKTLFENEFVDFGAPYIAKPKDFEEIQRDFFNILSEWEKQKINSTLQTKAFLYSTLAKIMGNKQENIANRESNDILTYIFDHYTNPEISVLALCERFYISESQLRRNIFKFTGMTTNEYITFLRLNHAKRELICTSKSVMQISRECGFSTPYYFSRCFRQHENLSPKEYRQSNFIL